MKRAQIRQRRTLADGRQLLNIVCPFCERRHWVPATSTTGRCPRRTGSFSIPTTTRSGPTP